MMKIMNLENLWIYRFELINSNKKQKPEMIFRGTKK